MNKQHAIKCPANPLDHDIFKVWEACTCDGYHTFDELYEHRIQLYIKLCKHINQQPYDKDGERGVWRSEKHSDSTKWDGWFILGIGYKNGQQITYHLPISKWEETNFAETLDQAPLFDGHTSDDVLERLKNL